MSMSVVDRQSTSPARPWSKGPATEAPSTFSWASPNRLRALSAFIAADIAIAWGVAGIVFTNPAGASNGFAIIRVGFPDGLVSIMAIPVAALGWWLGPIAAGSERGRAVAIAAVMAFVAMAAGGLLVGVGSALTVPDASSTGLLTRVAVGLYLGLFGVEILGWFFVLFVTGPSALAWVFILRSIGWLLTRLTNGTNS